MPGPLCLVGSGEFLSAMAAVDRAVLARLATPKARVAIVPTASAPEGPERFGYWSELGVSHFQRFGAEPWVAKMKQRADAHDREIAEQLTRSDFIYFSGGDPIHLVKVLHDSPAWHAIRAAHLRGAALAGCSAGAMALGSMTVDVRSVMEGKVKWQPALGLLPGLVILPHFDRMEHYRPGSVTQLEAHRPDSARMVGIDEETALIRGPDGWEVMGARGVTLFEPPARRFLAAGQRIDLDAWASFGSATR